MENQESAEAPGHPKQWILVVVVDVLMIAELVLAMYLASLRPDDFELIFMKRFFSMLVPTLAIAFLGKRFLRQATGLKC
jgi:hypothetical protein